MKYKTNTVLGVFLFFSIIFWVIAPGFAPAQTPSKSDVSKQTMDTQTKEDTLAPAKKSQGGG
jgi:hypothetical protein